MSNFYFFKRVSSHVYYPRLVRFTILYVLLSVFAFYLAGNQNNTPANTLADAMDSFFSSLAFLGKGPSHIPNESELVLALITRVISFVIICLWSGLLGWILFAQHKKKS